MKRFLKSTITLTCALLLILSAIVPASAASVDCTDYDANYRSRCKCADGGSWNGVELYEQTANYTSWIDVCNECFYEYTWTEWDAHAYEEGYIEGTLHNICQNCGTSYALEDSGNCVHSFKTTVIKPNCEERGYTWYDCQLCGYAYQGDWKDKTDHSYQYVRTVDPTCTKSGYVYYTCEWCGVPPSAEVGYTPPLGHTWATVSSEQTEEGMIAVNSECVNCHETKTEHFPTAAAQAQNWLTTAIGGVTGGLIDAYSTLANGIEVGGVTLGEVVTAALIVVVILAVLALIAKFLG